jgi:hypothetical protein
LPSRRIQSRTLRVRLPMMLSAYGGQEQDCISRPFGHIRLEGNQTPPTTRSIWTVEGAEAFQLKTGGGAPGSFQLKAAMT